MVNTRGASKRLLPDDFSSDDDQTATPAKRPRSSKAVQIKNEDDIDPVLNPEYFPFPGEVIDLEAAAWADNHVPLFSPSRVIPPRFLSVLDGRAGKPAIKINLAQNVRAERKRRFEEMLLNIVKGLQQLSAKCRTKWFSEHKGFKLFTNSFGSLLNQADSNWLVECLMTGIPESTVLAFADPKFSINSLLQLPRLSDGALSLQSVYLDCLEYDPLEDEDYRLYVGSATGQFGSLQRWHDYFKGRCTTRHGRESSDEGRTMNLRCVAHYGLAPEPFLPILAEGVFMVLLGTVDDPGYRSVDTARFVNTELYEAFKTLRDECKLPAPLARGLNSTWTFTQGWRGKGLVPGTKCKNCPRTVPPRKDPTYRREDWYFADSVRPSAMNVKCKNCVMYKQKHGKERPAALEERRPGLTPKVKHTYDKPVTCEYDGCEEAARDWCGKHLKWYCVRHRARANDGDDMDAEFKTVARPTKSKPNKCPFTIEGAPCPYDVQHWNNDVKEWLCKLHEGRARQGLNMDAKEKESPTKAKPAKCEATIEGEPCPHDAQYWNKEMKDWHCELHWNRARQGHNMDGKIKPKQVKTKPPPGPKPKTCQWPGCTKDVKSFHGKTGKFLCGGHITRFNKGGNMDEPLAPRSKKTT